jgi:hypothetical protein
MDDSRSHWQRVYTTKPPAEVSWHQERSTLSFALINAAAPAAMAGIIDVGGGASTLVDTLLEAGRSDLTVLDISEAALAHTKMRLGARAGQVAWVVADVTAWRPERTWDVWHDRAVFHFLTDTAQQDAYIAALFRATCTGASVIISTFAPEGPERCSGLPVQRYSAESLAKRLGGDLVLTGGGAEQHVTPWGSAQAFAYAVFRRR